MLINYISNLPRPEIKCSPFKNQSFSIYCLMLLIVAVLTSWIIFLTLLSGDIEVNPGPDSAEGSADSSSDSSISSMEMLSNHLSIFYLNIQSIVPKFDLIKRKVTHTMYLFSLKAGLNRKFEMKISVLKIFCRHLEQTGAIVLVEASLSTSGTLSYANVALT